jgi:hypothetical protein
MYESAADARKNGWSADEFEQRMLADEDMLDMYDGDREAFERELSALVHLVWSVGRKRKAK